jgi:hypothetical protein
MRKEELYLKLAKPFLRIGNYLMRKHVKALRRDKQKKAVDRKDFNGNR